MQQSVLPSPPAVVTNGVSIPSTSRLSLALETSIAIRASKHSNPHESKRYHDYECKHDPPYLDIDDLDEDEVKQLAKDIHETMHQVRDYPPSTAFPIVNCTHTADTGRDLVEHMSHVHSRGPREPREGLR